MPDMKQTQFKLSDQDKELLSKLTEKFQTDNNSDTLRRIIRETAAREDIRLSEDDGYVELFCSANSNCGESPRTTFKIVSKALTVGRLEVRVGGVWSDVIGWIEIPGRKGQSYPVGCLIAETAEGERGYLIFGSSTGGIRVLDEEKQKMFYYEGTLPAGTGLPWLFITRREDMPQIIALRLEDGLLSA